MTSHDIPALADAILGRTTLPPALDRDGDGVPDVLEPLMGLDSTKPDSNNDGTQDGDEDSDYDGLTNAWEMQFGTDPLRSDTDGDGWWDEPETAVGSNPVDANSRPYAMVVSTPPVALVLPADPPGGGLTYNTVVALPPVAVVLPADPPAGGLTNNTVVVMPPVRIQIPSP